MVPEEMMIEDELEVWRTVQALNRAWTGGQIDALEQFFHPEMVAVTPTDRERLDGRAACIDSWRRFVETATIHRWREHDPKVTLFGDAAVVSYYYELACEVDGRDLTLAGRDLLMLVKEDRRRWLVVADQFSEYPEG